MEINGVPVVDPNSRNTAAASKSLSDSFDTFLTLLTTQLQNQDPLDPLDSNQFTEQLVQFAEVEQAIGTNEKLDGLLEMQKNGLLNSAVSYVGKTVEVVSDQLMLKDGTARLSYGVDGNAAQTTIAILDKNGSPVRTINGEVANGRHELTWDGRTASGRQLQDGVYTFTVTAIDREGKNLDVITGSIGKVTGVEIVDDALTLNIDKLGVPFDAIFAVRQEQSEG